MIIVLNGPLGIGQSTLSEALTESVDQCVMLDGDTLVAANPPQADESIICTRRSRLPTYVADCSMSTLAPTSVVSF